MKRVTHARVAGRAVRTPDLALGIKTPYFRRRVDYVRAKQIPIGATRRFVSSPAEGGSVSQVSYRVRGGWCRGQRRQGTRGGRRRMKMINARKDNRVKGERGAIGEDDAICSEPRDFTSGL